MFSLLLPCLSHGAYCAAGLLALIHSGPESKTPELEPQQAQRKEKERQRRRDEGNQATYCWLRCMLCSEHARACP